MSASRNSPTTLGQAGLLAWKDLLTQFQTPVLLVFVVVMPLGMILITGLAFSGFEPKATNAKVAVVVAGDAARTRETAEYLQQAPEMGVFQADAARPRGGTGIHLHFLPAEHLTEEEAQAELASGKLAGALFFPGAFEAGRARLLVGPTQDVERFAVVSTVERILGKTEEQRQPAADGAGTPRWEVVPANGTGAGGPGFSSFSQAVSGNGVMFILINCIMSGALGLIHERRHHTLDRLLISPLSRGTILSGKILGVYLLGVMQAVVIFGFGAVVGVPMGNLGGVVLVTLVFILVGCSLGLLIAALVRREENVQLLGGPVALVMAALGGGMFPVEMAPSWMQWLALLFPTGWAMQAYHRLMWDGASVLTVLPNLLILAAFAVVFFLVGVRSLRWE
jgi:ABC-2 type transport system permease protein